ncbi:MAG: glycosyltransferase [Candidatus Falkowbacteria bacterium]
MDLSIIIVNYKSKIKLINCLDSIKRSDLSGISYEVVIVENNSGDDLSDLSSQYRVIISDQNLGMGGGNNLGIKNSNGDYILISNPDIVYESDTIKKLFNYFSSHPEIGLIGPKLLNPDGSLQYSCLRFPKFYIPVLRRTFVGRFFPKSLSYYLMESSSHEEVATVNWLLGACFMVRRLELNNDQLFDERYFMYFEDVDLGRQVSGRGQVVVYYPLVKVIHDHVRQSASLPWYRSLFQDKIAREHLKSAFKYFNKWRKIK